MKHFVNLPHHEPINLRSIYGDVIAAQIVVMLKYALAKNEASLIRNRVRARKIRDKAEYEAASLACREITREWRSIVNWARSNMPSSRYRLVPDYSMGYSGFETPHFYLYYKCFKRTIDIFEAEQAIFSLLTEESHDVNESAS